MAQAMDLATDLVVRARLRQSNGSLARRAGGWSSIAAAEAALRIAKDPLGPGPGQYLVELLERVVGAAPPAFRAALEDALAAARSSSEDSWVYTAFSYGLNEDILSGKNVVRMREFTDLFRSGTGCAVWPAALVLGSELLTRDLRGKRVLELGCGPGLLLCVALACGARPCGTDMDCRALENAAVNLELNGVSVDLRYLDWQQAQADGTFRFPESRFPAAERRFPERRFPAATPEDLAADLVVGSDVLYAETAAVPLARTLRALNAPAVLCNAEREAATFDAFYAAAEAAGLRIESLSLPKLAFHGVDFGPEVSGYHLYNMLPPASFFHLHYITPPGYMEKIMDLNQLD